MQNFLHTPIGQIVASNLATAPIFERHGLDFCCRGQQTLAQACANHPKKPDPAVLLAELAALPPDVADAGAKPEPSTLSVGALARHIVAVHHTFTRATLPDIAQHSGQVAAAHGAHHPEMLKVQTLFKALRNELELHLDKEEQILFPYIEALDAAAQQGAPAPTACFDDISQPIAMMEHEHENAGEILHQLAALTGQYTPPADACNTFRLLLRELAALEQDLHRHIALENYRLFPQAIKLENSL